MLIDSMIPDARDEAGRARRPRRPSLGFAVAAGSSIPASSRSGGERASAGSDVQLELVLADADVVAGLEAGLGQGGDDADLARAAARGRRAPPRFWCRGARTAARPRGRGPGSRRRPRARPSSRPRPPAGRRGARPRTRRAGSAAGAGSGASFGQLGEDPRARSSSSPSPVAEETASTPSVRVAEPLLPLRDRRLDLVRRQQVALARGRPARAAARARRRGRPARPAPSRSSPPGRPPSGASSTRWTSIEQRSTWARNSWPRPAPSAAPSISPGMSATTAWRSSPSIVPSTGESVVNG